MKFRKPLLILSAMVFFLLGKIKKAVQAGTHPAFSFGALI
jgi:hypothetical protein